MHHDSGGLLRQSASSGSGYIFTTGLIARPGIYLYEINGRMVRELVTREVLQRPAYLKSFNLNPLTVIHNPGPSGPHYTIHELVDGLLAGCTGPSWWNEAEDAQEIALAIWTADGYRAIQNGAIYLSPAYPARLHFFDEPQKHPEFGYFDAIQLDRGPSNHTTLTDNPRGGSRMKMKGDSKSPVANLCAMADSNYANTPFPQYPNGVPGYFQQQPQQQQQFMPRADMNGQGAQGGQGGDQMMQMMQQVVAGQKELTGAVMQLVQQLAGGQQQAPAQGDMNNGGMPPKKEEDKGDSYLAFYNERQDALAFADSLGVTVDPNWNNKQLKRAVVKAEYTKLGDSVSEVMVDELFKSIREHGLSGQAPAQPSGPPTEVRQRHQRQGSGLTRAAHARLGDSANSSAFISAAEVQAKAQQD